MATLEEQLELHEDFRSKPYRDTVGKLTIGIGRNLDDVGITKSEAYVLLRNDIRRAEADLDTYLPWWRKMDPIRRRVLTDMCFNMGIGSPIRGLRSFVNTLRAMEEGRYEDAANGMRASRWYQQVGQRGWRLARMMETGEDYDPGVRA